MLGSQHKDDGLKLSALSLVHGGGPSQLKLCKLCGAKVGHISHLACIGAAGHAWLQAPALGMAAVNQLLDGLQLSWPYGAIDLHRASWTCMGPLCSSAHSVALKLGI